MLNVGDLSLWGELDDVVKIADGIYFAYSPSHGGIMMSRDCIFVQEELSKPAQNIGQLYKNWICFEEDTAWAVAMYEIIYNDCGLYWEYEYYDNDPDHFETVVKETLVKYYPEYAAFRKLC